MYARCTPQHYARHCRQPNHFRVIIVTLAVVVLVLCVGYHLINRPSKTVPDKTSNLDTHPDLPDTDPDLPLETNPYGTYFSIEVITPEILDTIAIGETTSGYSPTVPTSTRSDELVAEMRAEALRSTPLLDIPLDAEFQYQVFSELCREEPVEFALIMAIAEKESLFTFDKIGDHGKSYGVVQINVIWHLDRMAKYGVTEPEQLFDPYLCMQVGLDYLDELMRVYQGSRTVTHYLLALYNAGPGQANKWWNEEGITSTVYSRHVMSNYLKYLYTVNQRLAEVDASLPFSLTQ